MRGPVTIATPTISTTPATAKMVRSYLQKVYKKLPFALSSTAAHKAIADREQKLADGLLQSSAEPVAVKRRIR
jgi:hypothetical protein